MTNIAKFPPHPLDSLFANLMSADYLARRRIMRFKIKERPRRFHYKYRPVVFHDPDDKAKGYSERSIDRLRQIIVNSRLYVSCPAEFNDPFDTAADLIATGTEAQRHERFDQWLLAHGVYDSAKRAELLADLMARPPEAITAMFAPGMQNARKTTGVISFAGNPRDTLMWSHYASEHTGVCFQFETARDFAILSRAVTGDYAEEYPVVNCIVNFQDGLGKMMMNKHPCWTYEDETRIIMDNEAGKYLPFRPDALRAIILGCRADSTVSLMIDGLLSERAAAGHPKLKVYRASMHGKKYELVIRKA
jgi:Protein of unknown function (DUF2971)